MERMGEVLTRQKGRWKGQLRGEAQKTERLRVTREGCQPQSARAETEARGGKDHASDGEVGEKRGG